MYVFRRPNPMEMITQPFSNYKVFALIIQTVKKFPVWGQSNLYSIEVIDQGQIPLKLFEKVQMSTSQF